MAFVSARASLLVALLFATALRSCMALSAPDCERKDGERAACSCVRNGYIVRVRVLHLNY